MNEVTPADTARRSSASSRRRAPKEGAGGPPWFLRGPVAGPAKAIAHVAALPIRRLAKVRPPAVADPSAFRPGDPPPTDGRLLLLFDGGCGICLHARDTFLALDWNHRLAHDRIVRHDLGLLSDVDPVARYSSWHTIHPDGRVERGAQGVAAALEEIPAGRLPAKFVRRFPGVSDAAYEWFVHNRGWISRGSGLINHPQRDPREQLSNPKHDEVAPPPAADAAA